MRDRRRSFSVGGRSKAVTRTSNDDRPHVIADPPNRWTLDKRVPLIIIFMVLSLGVGGIWELSKYDGRLTGLDDLVALHEKRIDTLEQGSTNTGSRLVRVETLVEQLLQTNVEIRDLLSRILLQIQTLPSP
jgi:hypothetical protein